MDVLYVVLLTLITILLLFLLFNNSKKALKEPIILMENSKISIEGMKKAKISFEELMSRARLSGFFNIGDIDCAIMEKNGEISFLLNPSKRRLSPKDFNFSPFREGISRIIISQGTINEKNLALSGIDKNELFRLIEERGSKLECISFATANEAGRIDFFE